MPPMGHNLPEDLVPGKRPINGSSYPMNVGSYDDNFEGNSPTESIRTPDAHFSRLGLEGEPSNYGGRYDGGYQTQDNRVGRQQEHGTDSRDESAHRNHSRPGGGGSGTKSPSGTSRICKKCGESLTGQFVRALGGTFHLECFRCEDCGQIVASKFFPVDYEDGSGQYPLCETDYFRRLQLLCFQCGGALRGSYITALDRKYHIEHFTCSVCPTVFGAQDSYYEHEGMVYCHYHYSTQFAQRCHGCHTAILKQFVEIFRNGQNQHWHPECYMIHKFWNVRLAASGQSMERPEADSEATDEERNQIREEEERMEDKVYRIWSILSTFEESSAACISDMLLHVSNGAYIDGVLVAKKFIWHVEILFNATDGLAKTIAVEDVKDLSYGRESKLLCKKIVAFFALLSKTQETGVRKLGVTQELLSLVTGLAHYLKLLIRIGLQGALRLERERKSTEGLYNFLHQLGDLEKLKSIESSTDLTSEISGLADQQSDCCYACNDPVDDACVGFGERLWHRKPPHLICSVCQKDLTQESLSEARWSDRHGQAFCHSCAEYHGHAPGSLGGFYRVSRLQQYVFLLRVALARLLSVLRSGGTLPHTSDDPNLNTYEANEGHRISPTGELQTPHRANTRSRSYAGISSEPQQESSLEQTVGEMKRLRSTRNERTLSTTFKKARASRVVDGPEGRSARPGSAGADGSDPNSQGFQIVEEQDANGDTVAELTFGNQDSLTLDDIPRIVAAEQAKEQRPNAYKHAGTNLVGSGDPPAKLLNGSRRMSGHMDTLVNEPTPVRTKRYFSELSALEYFIVRHVAVLSMEPLLEGQYNLEELLGLIESRKPTIWNIFGRAFKNDGRKGGKKKGIFGTPLDMLVERDGAESTHGVGPGALRVPALVDDAVSAMRQMDMSVEGVFRKNGNIRRLKDLTDMIDTKYDQVDLSKENPVQVAALLKKFLREMPDPLLTFKLHRLFVISQKIQDPEKQRRILHLTCCLLPKAHRDTMEVLFSFLNWTASFSHVDEESGSKMDVHNLATVMTPNILYASNKGPGVDDSFLAIEAVTKLIAYNDMMCEVPEDLQSILSDSSLFNGSADITTKEILKRYGDIGRIATPQRAPTTMDGTPVRTTSSRGNNAPIAARVESDPSQATATRKQSSVRHVQAPGAQSYPSQGQGTGQAPSHQGLDFTQLQQSEQRDRSASGGSLSGPGPQDQHQFQQTAYRPRPGSGVGMAN